MFFCQSERLLVNDMYTELYMVRCQIIVSAHIFKKENKIHSSVTPAEGAEVQRKKKKIRRQFIMLYCLPQEQINAGKQFLESCPSIPHHSYYPGAVTVTLVL